MRTGAEFACGASDFWKFCGSQRTTEQCALLVPDIGQQGMCPRWHRIVGAVAAPAHVSAVVHARQSARTRLLRIRLTKPNVLPAGRAEK